MTPRPEGLQGGIKVPANEETIVFGYRSIQFHSYDELQLNC
jgi:hypothetical protein